MSADDRDILAAEYVLGTLSDEERTAFAVDIVRDPDTRTLVDAWEARLGELENLGDIVEPSAGVFEAIEAQLEAHIPLAEASVTIRAEDDLWVTVREGLEKKHLFRDEAKACKKTIEKPSFLAIITV